MEFWKWGMNLVNLYNLGHAETCSRNLCVWRAHYYKNGLHMFAKFPELSLKRGWTKHLSHGNLCEIHLILTRVCTLPYYVQEHAHWLCAYSCLVKDVGKTEVDCWRFACHPRLQFSEALRPTRCRPLCTKALSAVLMQPGRARNAWLEDDVFLWTNEVL